MQKVLFLHFHKAAGSSIVNYFDEKGLISVPNRNGNPLNPTGSLYKLWEMDDAALSLVLDELDRAGNYFVAVEWGIPNLKLFRDKGYKVVTVIREPKERLISNYRFDIRYFIKNTPFDIYIDSPQIAYQRPDYYSYMIKLYLGKSLSSKMANIEIEEFLKNFDEIIVLEKGRFSKVLDGGIVKLESIPKKNRGRKGLFRRPIQISDVKIDQQDMEFFGFVKNR